MKDVEAIVTRIAKVRQEITAAMAMPAAARKELATAVIGHKNWNGYGLQEVRGADLHRAAVDAVTDKLVSDLAERKQAEIAALADELDALRNALAIEADKARFDLLDDVREAREWRYVAHA
jgi:hypothetical protein